MGICGQFLDAANDQQRDRVIEAIGWSDDFVDFDDHSCRCLTGHAEDWFRDEATGELGRLDGSIHPHFDGPWFRTRNRRGVVAFNQFPKLCTRFGKARIVAACKARAARGNAPTVTEIRKKVYRELVPVGGMSGMFPRDLP